MWNDLFRWLVHSPGGLWARIACGVGIFSAMAWIDWRKHGPRATRWREYLVLLACVAGAVGYGVINDTITSAISWEYFYYGKELATALGPATPPEPVSLRIAAAAVGAKATWTAGLIIGVGLLVANNPSKRLARLANRNLAGMLPMILLVTVCVAGAAGVAGGLGLLTPLDAEFGAMVRTNLWRPYRFMAVYGTHLGGYIGGAAGLGIAIVRIRGRRRRWGQAGERGCENGAASMGSGQSL